MSEPIFKRLTLIGLGLIGSSLARRAMQHPTGARRIAGEIVACDSSGLACDRVRVLGIADRVEPDATLAVRDADCVVLCVPVGALGDVAARIMPHLAPGAILSDVGSTKQSMLREIEPILRADVALVPGHPLAGTEYSGPDAGFSTLFENRWCLLTPPEGTDPGAVARVAAMWNECGARSREMDAAHHDRVLAIVSHLPHLLAFTICGTADDLADETRSEVLEFAATGFRDFTRIAASDPVMWRDIFLNNREALLEMLARFTEDAQAMARAIRWGDDAFIVDRIERGRAIRRSLIELNQA
ncbi:prephenate/arogenate dehydrogenase family protein [Lichenicoccus roseus]|uniref:prephenate dehydrogenase n=1 Tax=Lichenicoccus roseus TaxID=2683649 RepID=A0A5R9J6G6_9PROT|nr:prephenate/arogenate dehydrogenase family protein [Lichenicoccus roseus]TLU72087.1 prephenate/arogenate dehydrogenase family protein [Lichenicoccus roseus]